MFDKFSEAARTMIFWARYEAGRLRFESIDTAHLVLGFINVDRGSDGPSLAEVFGLPQASSKVTAHDEHDTAAESFLDAQTAVQLRFFFSSAGSRSEPMGMGGDMPLSESAKRVLSEAFEFADGMKVSPLHLLWAMLSVEQGQVAATLVDKGITRERIENEIRRRTGGVG